MAEVEEGDPPSAQPQVVRSGGEVREVWPEHWGITLAQCRGFLEECKSDPEWDSSNNVYTLVEKYVKPQTRGTGVGYALLQNLSAPKEVTVMVSHAWGENAEEFVQVLGRSVREDEVMFVCALSLYQCQDGEGPTIAEQLGSKASESPFRRVLEHIRERGSRSPGWEWRAHLQIFSLLCLWAAQLCYYVVIGHWGCIPTFNRCAIGVGKYSIEGMDEDMGCVFPKWKFHFRDLEPHEKPCLPVTIALIVIALLVHLATKCRGYNGRLLAVPNREGDLYGRLWCVYEIFVGMMLGIRTDLAKTLASAGTCSAETATCGSADDTRRIHAEIAAWGQGALTRRMTTLRQLPRRVLTVGAGGSGTSQEALVASVPTVGAPPTPGDGAPSTPGFGAPSKPGVEAPSTPDVGALTGSRAIAAGSGGSEKALTEGWRRIDQAIQTTTRRAQRIAVYTVLQWVLPYLTIRVNMTLAQGSFTPTPLFSSEICAGIYSQVLAIVMLVLPVLWVVLRSNGRPSFWSLLALSIVLTLFGVACREVDRHIAKVYNLNHEQIMKHWPPLHHCFGIEMRWAGKVLGLLALCGRFCPTSCFMWRWRVHFLLVLALAFLVATVVHGTEEPVVDQIYPITVWYASFRILPVVGPILFFWGAAATWGVDPQCQCRKR